MARTIQNGGNLARYAHAASGILVELAHAGLGYDDFWHSLSRFLVSGTVALAPLPLFCQWSVNSGQWSVKTARLPSIANY
jgi:hypothetical protein